MSKHDELTGLDAAMDDVEARVEALIAEGIRPHVLARWCLARLRRVSRISVAIDKDAGASQAAAWVNSNAVDMLAGEGA